MAEREGFEPPIPFQVCPLSRRIVSTTHAPLRAVKNRGRKDILTGTSLFLAQGLDRIHFHRPSCRNVAEQAKQLHPAAQRTAAKVSGSPGLTPKSMLR